MKVSGWFAGFGCAVAIFLTVAGQPLWAASSAPELPDGISVYRSLRTLHLSQEAIPVQGFRMKRDAGIFTFRSGHFYLLEPVAGKCTGAVFIGEGVLALTPPIESEERYLQLLAKEEFVEQFHTAVFRFTDGTEEELRKASAPEQPLPANQKEAADLLAGNQETLRKHLKQNLDARILQDLLGSPERGIFIAFIKGSKYGGKLIYEIDPQGVVSYSPDPPAIEVAGPRVRKFMALAPEEVALIAWDENHEGIWTSFHLNEEYKNRTASSTEFDSPFRIDSHKLDVRIAKNGLLEVTAETTVTALRDGVRVLGMDLFPTLRVNSVTGSGTEHLQHIQEPEEEDADLAVILPKPLTKGEKYSFTMHYAGKHAVEDNGDGRYFPRARSDWYPSLFFPNYSDFQMTFHVPKKLTLVATGKLVNSEQQGGEVQTVWQTEAPQNVAGFNIGQFKSESDTDLSKHYGIATYVNEIGPYGLMMKKATNEAKVALDLYSQYFGEEPYTKLALTQQDAFNFGQSWPGLVFLPKEYFLDSTQRHFDLHHGFEHGFYESVGPHEIAHQWWGHKVGWTSYRDQWMSEGFAEFSAGLFLQSVYTDHLAEYHSFWAEERKRLNDVNGDGKRAIDVGPLTLGYRLANAKTGFNIPRDLMYPKGAYILQMLRFMMQDSSSKDVDARFKAMMTDFCNAFPERPASTEDFKAFVEKHMTREMDLGHDHTMSWFFDEYVYGTQFPSYRFEHSFVQRPDGAVSLKFKLTQSKVDEHFKMILPIYLELEKGQVARLGRIAIEGDTTLEREIVLPRGIPKPRRAMLAYLDDVLAQIENK